MHGYHARQLLVNASKRALILLLCNGLGKGAAHPGVEDSPPPKHDVTEGFMMFC